MSIRADDGPARIDNFLLMADRVDPKDGCREPQRVSEPLLEPVGGGFVRLCASRMTSPKRKVSLSLDEDLVEELEIGGEGLSSQANEAIRAELKRRGSKFQEVRAALEAARRLEREVIVPAVVLAELYRGPQHNQTVDACLSRETAIYVRDTGRSLVWSAESWPQPRLAQRTWLMLMSSPQQ